MRVATLAPLFALLACRPASPPSEPETEAPPAVFGEQPAPEVEPPAEPLAPITAGVCPAEVGMVPTPYFEERVLIRLPAGLDESTLIEVGPYLARSQAEIKVVDCRADASVATILAAGLSFRPDQEVLSLEAVRDHAIAEFGYPSEFAVVEGLTEPDSRRGLWVVEFQATRALVALRGSSGFMVALLYETHPEHWPALVDSFVESAKRMFVVPG